MTEALNNKAGNGCHAEVTATVIRDPDALGDLQEDSSEDEDLLLDNKI